MNIFTFTGWSGTGKTTLISRLIRELSGRGWKVTAIKRAPDKIHFEPEGKDSRRYLESGAQCALLVTENQFMKMKPVGDPGDILKMEKEEIRESDFVLVEGKITENSHFIEVFDPDISGSPKSGTEKLAAVVSDVPHFNGIRHFKRDRIGAIADFLETKAEEER